MGQSVEVVVNDEELLSELLRGMDIPALRRDPTPRNLAWLGRNLAVNNGAHPDLGQALALVRALSHHPRG